MTKRRPLRAIRKTKAKDIQDVLDMVRRRYQELYPDWEISFFSIQRESEAHRKEQLRRILEFAEKRGV